MAQPQLLQIKLSRFDAQPWGFRLQGGVDFATPLVVQKVNGGSLAESAGLIPGDAVLKINDVDVYNLRHKEAQDVVVRSGNNFVLTVQRGGSTWRPHIAPTGNLPQPQQNSPYLQTVTKTSLAHKQQEGQHIGCGYNNAARPFANGGDGSVKSIVNKQYNTPVGIYSDESIAETLSAQAEVLAGGVLGVNFKKNEKEYQADKSEVLKFLREEETGHSTPEPPAPANFYWTQSHAIGGNERRTPLSHQHQQHSQQEQPQDERVEAKSLQSNAATNEPSRPGQASKEAATPAESVDPRVIIMPVCPALQGPEYKAELEAAAAALQHDAGPRPLSASGHPACALCGVGIVGVFVRIKDKNLHVECFKCATCGTSLKNQGYYNFNNKLYCDIHAKLAAMQHPPSGTDGYVPVPIKPNTKLSANTISSALNAHGFSDIPYSNGGSAKPSPVPGAQLHEWTDANKEDNTDLPLPPPPSPTLLQQLEIDSQCRGYIDDNTTDTKQQLQHTRTNSSSLSTLSNTSNSPSMSSEAHSIHNLAIVEGIEGTPPTSMAGSAVAVDEKSSGYASTTSLHSRQTSSSSSSVCGISRDADISSLSSPPPPPPLPPSLPIQMIQQPHRQQNENDMNSQNQYGNGGGLAGSGVGSKNSPSGGVYSKFLKEYSNKLLTHSNNNKTQTNPLFLDNSPNNSFNSKNSNKTIVTNNSQNRLNDTAPPYQPTTQISAVAHPQSIQNLNSTSTTTAAVAVTSSATATAAATAKSKTTHPSVVAAIATTPPNLLNFNPCQQVAKAATASATSPPAVSLPPPTTTAISAIINNATSLDTANSNSSSNSKSSNRCEGGQLSESENTHDTAKEITSAMLANQSSALDDSLNDQPFGEYVTLTGSVIRSVVPPGKGVNINYKVNQGYARPFGAASGPPAAAPKSPVSYAPQRPAVNPYATLPRTNIGQQDNEESLQLQYAEECRTSAPIGAEFFEEDHELVDANRQNRNNFSWPPRKEDSPIVPTAAPLYIAPPETQHVVVKPLKSCQPQSEDELTKEQTRPQPNGQQYLQPNWQSKSAPELTIGLQPPEIESSSESFTSTSTTTTTTSEEYQRMYAAQVQAYQSQQMYEQQSGSELDYHMDMEVATMQQNLQDSSCISSSEYISGRRSAQECVESLVAPLNTYKLIDMVREVTPSPVPPPSNQGPRHVVFVDEPMTKEISVEDMGEILRYENYSNTNSALQSDTNNIEAEQLTNHNISSQKSTNESETFVKTQRGEILENQRIFQPTPEIKIEIAPVRQIPPSKIPNPVPKEWINPMVKVLTTAPDVPFHLVECPCPKPCEGEFVSVEPERKTVEVAETLDIKNSEIIETKPIEEAPPKGSRLASAMTTAPEWEVVFQPPPSEMIPLPEETAPYMPPPIDMKPYMREDYRPKSPFVSALTTAPERPFEGHFDRDVPIHLIDLPTPKEHLTFSDALCTAPDRAYTPLNPENATLLFEKQEMEKEKKKHEFQVLDREKELGITALNSESIQYYTTAKRENSQQRKSSAFAAMQAFQPTQEPLTSNTPRQSITSFSKEEFDPDYERYYKAKERNKKRIDYYHKKEEELQQQQVEEIKTQETSETNTRQMSSLSSFTKQSSSSESSSAVQTKSNTTSTSTYASNLTQASKSSYQSKACIAINDTKIDLHDVIEETSEELEHSEVLFPPPSPLSHLHGKSASSGLHKADTIPKYQRNWTILPTQSPVRTPEPQELRENVPLAFVDAPVASSKSSLVHKPVAQISDSASISHQQQQQQVTNVCASRGSVTSTTNILSETKKQQQSSATQQQSRIESQTKKPVVPIIIEERVAPQITMAFQSLDEHLQTDESQTPSRPYTPSLSNKPVPVVPFYQTPEALCFDECPATHARTYDRRSASPYPDRARSPAPGPPPNPLAAIRSPRAKDNELSSLSPRVLQAGSITTGQSYLGAQQQQQQQTQILSHYEHASKTGSQSYTVQPEKVEEQQIGDYMVQRREKESHKADQKQSSLESQTKMKVGDTQIERRRRVTEEYEHTQSARSVEIRTGSKTTTVTPAISATERRQSYGKTGYVANQARRLSGLEQEITNLTSQSQAISARAATLTDTSFPQISSPEPVSKFPTKALLPPHDEPKRPDYLFSATPYNKMVGPPPGFNKPEQKQQQLSTIQVSTACGASMVSQQQKSLSTYSSSNFTTSTSTASSLSSQANAANVSSLTKASITNNKLAGAASATTSGASAICPVTGTFCRPGHTCCRQQQLQAQTPATDVVKYNDNNNVTYRPNAFTGITDIKPNAQATAIAADTASTQAPPAAPATSAAAPTSFPPPNTIGNNKSNAGLGGSTGVGGKGAFGATSAPKRGRGIFNKAVGPGVRVPLCNSCNIQIRGPFITALGRIWCPEHFICVNANCRRALQDIGFVEEKGDLYCEYCFEKYLAPTCSKCGGKIKGDCLNAIGKQFHPECFTCGHCGKLFGNTPFFLEDGNAYCEADWNELFTTKCFACGFPVEAGDRWVEALNHNYHSQCFNCTYCKQNLEGQSFYNKGGRPFCKNHAR
ncbi:PDZ and LIM domain protein Zasp isoform X7 [Anastrepha obliqua]|uniref:PDZ and LIM domain protein Zasp isoform X7 n=1 Tax=Anastrepha obliqua TaxID=95512 RepID=UPI00240928CB|nr:PDZ and LIM domain protein Zasp isoform X7 [Anastrepha obliqua]